MSTEGTLLFNCNATCVTRQENLSTCRNASVLEFRTYNKFPFMTGVSIFELIGAGMVHSSLGFLMTYRTHLWMIAGAVVALGWGQLGHAQSRLDGTSFLASTYNLPDSVGVVRLIDVPGSDCGAGGVEGDDVPGEECLTVDSGGDPVSMTFNTGPQAIGGLLVTPTAVEFAGRAEDDPILANNFLVEDITDVALTTWETPGDILEFTMRTADDSLPWTEEIDFFGFTAAGIQYPNSDPAAEVGQPFMADAEGDGGNYVNSYIWFENADGPILTGYDIFLPVGIGVGQHPTDNDRQVVYPFWSRGQADDYTDTPAGGSLDFYSHGSQLDSNPMIGNLLFLADGVGIDGLDITGWGFGLHVLPPEELDAGLVGDFNDNELIDAGDIDLLSMNVGMHELAGTYDLNDDALVDEADRVVWIEDIAMTATGDANLDGEVEFGDFLTLSANFGGPGGWADGDFDGSGDIQFADFLQLSGNFGFEASTQAVPEPNSATLALMGMAVSVLLLGRRPRNRQD